MMWRTGSARIDSASAAMLAVAMVAATAALVVCPPGFEARAAGAGPDLCATFSIVARDSTTGEIGVGVQSHWFSVGSTVPWAEAGVGAVATQSFVEVAYGPRILEHLRRGESAAEALQAEVEADTLRAMRQVLVIDAKGNVAVHTGEECVDFAGSHIGRDHACAGNLLAAPGIWDSMSRSFEAAEGSMAARIIAALESGQAAGGDARGMQSAALLVVKMIDAKQPWKNRTVDLRVEDHRQPIYELSRLYDMHRGYTLADQGDEAFARKDYRTASLFYDAAIGQSPSDELLFWRASVRMAMGEESNALDDLEEAISVNPRWRTLLARLPDSVFPGVEKACKRLGIDRIE